MLRSLRNRLILSHVLPLLIIIPVMGLVLIYELETRYIIPRMANNLLGDARMISEITRSEYTLLGSPFFFEQLLDRVEMDPSIRVMFLDTGGVLLYSSDPADSNRLNQPLQITGLDQVRNGGELVTMQYRSAILFTDIIDVFTPVFDPGHQVIGIVRVSYHVASSSDLLPSVRTVIIVVMLVGLGIGLLLSLLLAVNIERPINKVTRAIYDLAQGTRSQPVVEQGPRELRSLIHAVNYLVERLANLEQSRRQLLANLVHEIGRPLGALHSASQALVRGAGKDPVLLKDLAAGMDDEITQMEKILNDLAQLHDQIVGTTELKRESVLPGEWLARVLLPWQEVAREKGVIWKTFIPEDLPPLMMDPGRMAQAVGNLASNAVKYTPGDHEVTVSAGTENGELWIRISDTGIGISPEDRQKIFSPFFRSNQGRHVRQGMGLGLTIASDLVKAHGGRIDLESTQGSGSQFTIRIPLYLP